MGIEILTHRTNVFQTKTGWKVESMHLCHEIAKMEISEIYLVILRLYEDVRRMAMGNMPDNACICIYLPFSFKYDDWRNLFELFDDTFRDCHFAYSEEFGKDMVCVTWDYKVY